MKRLCYHLKMTPLTAVMLILTGLIMAPPAVRAAEDPSTDATFDSAVFLLRQSMRVTRDGSYNVMLRSLRHLADPKMAPLFSDLAASNFPVFKIHGLLGLAECSPDHRIDLVRLAAVQDPAVQAELVSAALDSKLLTLDQCQQLVDWPGLDVAVKVIVSAPLVKAGRLKKIDALLEAAKATNPARKGLASLLLVQLGHTEYYDELDKLNEWDNLKRDAVRGMLLTTAVRYDLDRVGPWAMKIATEPNARAPIGLLALSVAMRFNTPGSASIWTESLGSTTDVAQRTRLALLALRVSRWAQPILYQPLIHDTDPLLAAIGAAGQAVASQTNITPAVVKLIALHHPIANSWALQYASDDAPQADASHIFLALVLAYEQGPRRGRAERLDDAMSAVQRMVDRNVDDAIVLLKPILANEKTPDLLVQGIVLGLIRAKSPRAHEVVAGLKPFEDINTRNLVLLLLAQDNQPLSPGQLSNLALCVRGGGLPQDALRIQAAWLWLKRTGQTLPAIDQAIKP